MKPTPVHCPNCKSTRINLFKQCRPIACACLDCFYAWQPAANEPNIDVNRKADTKIAVLLSCLFIIFMVGSMLTANTYFDEHMPQKNNHQLSETRQKDDPDSISNYGLQK